MWGRARWIAIAASVFLVAFGVMLAVQHRNEPAVPRIVQQHRTVPPFVVTGSDGKALDSAALRGKTYVVNVFNSWCIPCRQEAPALRAFYAEHEHEADFAMIGIVRDDDEGAVRAYVSDQQFRWRIAFDPNGSAALGFGTTGQPETYVITASGVAACGTLGASSFAELDAWLQVARTGEVCP
jgi:cytochrome c biogenesis protein CcmG/thiol:disulfide interchange protein DsbE